MKNMGNVWEKQVCLTVTANSANPAIRKDASLIELGKDRFTKVKKMIFWL